VNLRKPFSFLFACSIKASFRAYGSALDRGATLSCLRAAAPVLLRGFTPRAGNGDALRVLAPPQAVPPKKC
jgi:hypothetical protein